MDSKRLLGYLKYDIIFNDTVVEDLGHFPRPNAVSKDDGYGNSNSCKTSEQDQIEWSLELWSQYTIGEVDLQWWIIADDQSI